MKLKRYCVTVMDHWTPTRTFWTLEGAKKFYREHRNCANVFKWEDEHWSWMCGANEPAPPVIKSPTDVLRTSDLKLRNPLHPFYEEISASAPKKEAESDTGNSPQ